MSAEAEADLETYFRAMREGMDHVCSSIEQRWGLYGYPPQIVSIGLHAAARGESVGEAIDAYLAEQQS